MSCPGGPTRKHQGGQEAEEAGELWTGAFIVVFARRNR